jgi:lipopolysaccharide export system protein LptA
MTVMLPMIPNNFRKPRALLALLLALPMCASALPEDDAQQIDSDDFLSLELSLNEGEWVQTAHTDRPTCITQGSRKVCGTEIRLQRNENGTLKRVTATGNPASFEEQPEAGAAIVHFSGATLVYDQQAQLLTMDGDAQFSRGTDKLTSEHIEYHLDTRRVVADAGNSDASSQFVITPEAPGKD